MARGISEPDAVGASRRVARPAGPQKHGPALRRVGRFIFLKHFLQYRCPQNLEKDIGFPELKGVGGSKVLGTKL